MTRRGNRKVLVAALVAAVVLGTGSVVVLTRLAADQAAAAPLRNAPAKTAQVTRTNLADQQSVTGQLAYGAERVLTGRKGGTVTGLPATGAVVDRGQPVYWADAKPVPLFHGGLPLYRELESGMTNGPDVRVVEENLAALGFEDFGEPDEKFTYYTATALKKWQKANGLEQTGKLSPGDVVVQPGAVRVSSLTAQLGAPATGDLMKVTGTERAVTVELEQSKQRLAKQGEKVELSISGGKTTTGTITTVTRKPGDENQGQKPKIVLTISVDDVSAAEGLDTASVTALFTVAMKPNVLAVPVGALLALDEGGYGVVTEDGKTVPVTVGIFAKGKVEVRGDGLREGMKVVTTE
ncbi:Putative peptidoglycan binding domain-containing protein [Lentzea fradiae]|uniref:Putative peptidoglycan binding domain-containing protein n=1 Tax=Lentzea fradiae TaxID=200378 RepID=A0A1G7YXK3_9PSEU|nr:peptidoglycan-binding domain-containing protein [Lentzea fradiae]SDH01258.1 Putative peptidoglycan binding domain-containing protein [Lentzea fradiae]